MKKKLSCLCLGVMLCMLSASPVVAQEKSNELSFLTDANQQITIEQGTRGNVISTGTLRISNEGKGAIGVYMQTLAHSSVDETTFTVFLDRWIESEERWANVAHNSFTYLQEDYPDEDLSMKSVSFNIVGQPVDCYYRLRGLHSVTAGDIHEMLSSKTDGILITK